MTNKAGICIILKGNLKSQGRFRIRYIPSRPIVRNSSIFYTHIMKRNFSFVNRFTGFILFICASAFTAAAQSSLAREREFVDSSSDRYIYTIIFVVVVAFGGAIFFWRRSKKGADQPQFNYGSRYNNYYSTNASYDMEGLDADKELEWLRKAKRSSTKPSTATGPKSPTIKYSPKTTLPIGVKSLPTASPVNVNSDELNLDTKLFQEKMRKLQYSQLPINSFTDLTPSKRYEPLPLSDDKGLLNAIEQANEEYEEDETIRDLAVRILTAFRTRNSIDALTQIALYDLSANLRSKAVSTLTDFDHESVFEAILLACADPTREVRAAAARGLFRLNFDRADAWKRIIETNDEFRMSHAARAAVESGIVGKSFERLVHEDLKVAYEAFALVTLLIRSGETSEIFAAIKNHRDERVKFALLHVLKTQKDERSLVELERMRVDATVPTDVADRIRETISSFEHVAV